jgi:hypothetical protein
MIDRAGPESRLRAPSIFVLVLSWLAAASVAHAEPPHVSWSAPAGCPDETAVQARVAQLLARSAVNEPLSASGRITTKRDGYTLTLELDQGGHHGKRALEGHDCASLAEAAAFLIAVTVDPNLKPPPEEAEPLPTEPEPKPEAKPQAAKKPEPAPSVERPRGRATTPWIEGYRAALTLGGFHAGLAGPSPELGLALGLAFSWLRVELRGAHVFARTESASRSGVRGRFDSQQLGLAACPEWGGRIRGGPCAWASVVRTHATTRGLQDARDLSLFWAVAGLSLAGRARLSERVELSLEGGAGVPVSARPRFVVAGAGTLGEVGYLSGYVRLGVGLELR